MKFHSWWDLQTPQFKASVGSVDDVRAGYVAGYSYGHSDCRKRMAQIERENKELRAKVAELESALKEIAGIKNLTATDKQFAREIQSQAAQAIANHLPLGVDRGDLPEWKSKPQ